MTWTFEKGNKVMVKHDYKIVTFMCRVKHKGEGFTKIRVLGGGAKCAPNSYNTCPWQLYMANSKKRQHAFWKMQCPPFMGIMLLKKLANLLNCVRYLQLRQKNYCQDLMTWK